MDITKKFKDNLGVVIAICTVIGVGIGILNFFILVNVAPLQREVIANGESIKNIENTFMPLDLSMEKWKNNEANHLQIEKKLDTITIKIDRLLEK